MVKITLFQRSSPEEPNIVEIQGKVDVATESSLRTCLHAIISQQANKISGNIPFLFDMSEIDYIDCSGLRVLISAVDELETLKPPPPIHILASSEVARIIKICQLESRLNLHRTPRSVNKATENAFEAMYWHNPCPQAI